jgi:hypothetical protein
VAAAVLPPSPARSRGSSPRSLGGEPEEAAAAAEKKNAAIEGIFGSLGNAALGAFEGSDLYKQNKYKP